MDIAWGGAEEISPKDRNRPYARWPSEIFCRVDHKEVCRYHTAIDIHLWRSHQVACFLLLSWCYPSFLQILPRAAHLRLSSLLRSRWRHPEIFRTVYSHQISKNIFLIQTACDNPLHAAQNPRASLSHADPRKSGVCLVRQIADLPHHR